MIDRKNLPSLEEIKNRARPVKLVCGVYFLFRAEELVYVGQSINVMQRVGNHCKLIEFDSFSYIEVEPARLDFTERLCIGVFKPLLNVAGHKNSPIKIYSTMLRLKQVLKDFDISQEALANAIRQEGKMANNKPLSYPGLSQLLNWNIWPSETPRERIKEQTEAFLRGKNIPESIIRSIWEQEAVNPPVMPQERLSVADAT